MIIPIVDDASVRFPFDAVLVLCWHVYVNVLVNVLSAMPHSMSSLV